MEKDFTEPGTILRIVQKEYKTMFLTYQTPKARRVGWEWGSMIRKK